MADEALIQHYDDLVRVEAKGMLEPLVERVTREYLMVDRNQACELMSMSRTFFEKYLYKQPQLKLIEHHVPGSKKVFYDPNELKQAVLSLMD
ncbi:hypothetical protein [Levilactobacillus enshiensis]|uniref:hypothetical protein n=1 Tax=Levilactobacillus enshiensis TaxID=2590213 RepID=UPI00117A856A|nr:hypothetical protein [Levilactobacillus enshiensis]